jgi:AhpD family alkylhydroperoxidase
MARIRVHTREDVPAEAREAVTQIAGSVGRLSHMLGELAHNQAVFGIYLGKNQALKDHGTFDAKTREAIALAMANQNGCEYCEASHTRSGRRAGWTDEEMIAIRAGKVTWDPKLSAMTELVRDASANTGDVSDGVWKAALDAGWTEDDLAEAFAHIMGNLFNNYFNRYARTEFDFPAAPALPE